MRTIRFRVWDKISSTMWYPGQAKYCLTMIGTVCEDETDEGGMLESRGYRSVAMLSTGLKDKSGVEIYEGDIVHCVKAKECREIFMPDGVAGFFVKGDGMEWPLNEIRADSVEVVGNIHDHPHLLPNQPGK